MTYNSLDFIQPVFDEAHLELKASLYRGKWCSSDSDSSTSVVVQNGTLFVNNSVSNGSDVIITLPAPGKPPLRS